MWPAPGLALAVSVGTMGCAQPDDATPEPFWNLLRDGIEVGAASMDNLDSMEPQPVPQGRPLEGGGEYSRLQGGGWLPDGEVVLLERIPPALLVFGGDGTLVRRWGSEGDGPGELRMPAGMAVVPPDTVLVHDLGLSRFTWYLRDGTVARTEADPVGSPGYIGFELLGVDAAGGILGIRDEFGPVDLEPGERHRPLRMIVRLEGVPLREIPLIELPGIERELREMIPGQFASAPAPGGADTRVVPGGPCTLVVFETEARTLAAFDLSGALGPSAPCPPETGARTVALSLPPDPVDSEGERILLVDPRTPNVTGALTLSVGMTWLTAGDGGAIVLHVDDLGVPTPHLVLPEDLTP